MRVGGARSQDWLNQRRFAGAGSEVALAMLVCAEVAEHLLDVQSAAHPSGFSALFRSLVDIW